MNIATLIGETITSIEGMTKGSDCITIACESGRTFRMYHEQDCCENVLLEDVAGYIVSIVGFPVTMSYETTSEDKLGREFGEEHLWTFYTIATVQGTVVLRWLGESNGYYSVGVSFDETTPESLRAPVETFENLSRNEILSKFDWDVENLAEEIIRLRFLLRGLTNGEA